MSLIFSIHIQIIFKVLKHVHVILSFFVLPHSWKREGLVVQLKCVHQESSSLIKAFIFLEFSKYFESIFPMGLVQGSWKPFDLLLELQLWVFEIFCAFSLPALGGINSMALAITSAFRDLDLKWLHFLFFWLTISLEIKIICVSIVSENHTLGYQHEK
mgnify:CR=1 FL=1